MVFHWLALDYVWMFVYWKGTAAVLGAWNPFTGSGANFWCHTAFHADSTLAIARMIYLYTLFISADTTSTSATVRVPIQSKNEQAEVSLSPSKTKKSSVSKTPERPQRSASTTKKSSVSKIPERPQRIKKQV